MNVCSLPTGPPSAAARSADRATPLRHLYRDTALPLTQPPPQQQLYRPQIPPGLFSTDGPETRRKRAAELNTYGLRLTWAASTGPGSAPSSAGAAATGAQPLPLGAGRRAGRRPPRGCPPAGSGLQPLSPAPGLPARHRRTAK